jgi:hypothetical protein
MMNWENGHPNARYWVLRLLKENFGPGDQLLKTSIKGKGNHLAAQGIITKQGRKILLINKHNSAVTVVLPSEAGNAVVNQSDILTGENPPAKTTLSGTTIVLKPFAVAIVDCK